MQARIVSGVTPRWRSLLFAPGDRPERFAKAVASGADCVCLDLEDGVAPSRKDEARAHVGDFVSRGERASVALAVRINPVGTERGQADLAAVADCARAPDALLLPKVGSAADLERVRAGLAFGEPVGLVPLVESAAGLMHAIEIAAAPDVVAVFFGGLDLAADLGAAYEWEALLYARSLVVHGAALAGIGILDAPWLAIDDLAGLEAETLRARALGFTGKSAIHPQHIATIHAALQPTDAEVGWARRVLGAFAEADEGVTVVDGRMVDAPVIRAAKGMLARSGPAPSGDIGAGKPPPSRRTP